MQNKSQNELLRGISNLDYSAVQLHLNKGANPNFEYPKEALNQENETQLSDFYTPLELLLFFQRNYNTENPKTVKNIEAEVKIATILMDFNANPKPALALATQIYGEFNNVNTKKSGCKELLSKLFYQQGILTKNYAKFPKTILNQLLVAATEKLDLQEMNLLLKSGANPKVKQLKMNELLLETVSESLEIITEIDASPDMNLLKKIEYLLQLGANPNYKIPKKEYPNYSYENQPFSALRLLVFSISDARKTNTNRDLELEIADLLLKNGADAKCAMTFAEKRHGKYNPHNELDYGQKLLNLIASEIKT